MKLSFAFKLAKQNIQSNRQIHLPYILSSIMTVAMFFMMGSLYQNPVVQDRPNTLQLLFQLGMIVIGIFSLIFILYANSFVMKRRKKEIGLYNVLGLEKGHIARVIAVETVLSTAVSITAGLIVGGLFGQLNFWILNYILELPLEFTYGIESSSLIITVGLFIGIFFIAYLYNLANIQFSNPIELLKGGNKGETEPKSKWILFVLGLIALGGGYYISLSIDDPIQAIFMFFVAVLLVIIGTYFLFNAGSIIILKRLKKNKNFYYKPGPFISISGMLYRMKQHATGLANICLLSVMVIIAISTTVALYVGGEETLNLMFPEENVLTISNVDNESEADFNAIQEEYKELIEDKTNNLGLEVQEINTLVNTSFFGRIENDKFVYGGRYYQGGDDSDDVIPSMVTLISLEEYNRLQGEDFSLDDEEILLFTDDTEGNEIDTLNVEGEEYRVRKIEEVPYLVKNEVDLNSHIVFVFSDQNQIRSILDNINEDVEFVEEYLQYEVHWTTSGLRKEKIEYAESMTQLIQNRDDELYPYYENFELTRMDYIDIVGGFLFLGIYLGLLFVVGTILITYFKQISEGFDDREKIQAMQKVGLDKETTRKSTRSQVVWMFLLPLIVAVIHTGFAYPILYQMINVLGRISHSLLLLSISVIVLAFAVIYGAIYHITSKVYLNIVE